MDAVKVKFAKNLSEGITVRFDLQTLGELRKRAKALGMGPTTLVRMWVMQRLAADPPAPDPPAPPENIPWGDYEQGQGAWKK